MKKVVRMLGLCALVALAFTACKKDDTQKVTFTASITQPTSNARTHAVGYGHHLVWDAGDEIKVFNGDGTRNMDFALPTNLTSAQQATFEVVGNDEVAFISPIKTAPYYAFFPYAEVEGEQVKMVIPAEQAYVPQRNFATDLYPMVGFNGNDIDGYTDNFDFISNAGFLNVSITCPQELTGQITIDQVILRSLDDTDILNGNVYYDKNGSNYSFDYSGTNEIVMTPEEPVTLVYTSATDFTFVLPEGALWSGFVVEVYHNGEILKSFEALPEVNTIEAMTYTGMLPVSIGNENQIVILP